ncbi:hypothetical protein MICRO8M_50160 [Microbacterium sp. 8M]|nr:hypothetical protein MICRO8M_50160 [Microbacterium sp. 8M]
MKRQDLLKLQVQRTPGAAQQAVDLRGDRPGGAIDSRPRGRIDDQRADVGNDDLPPSVDRYVHRG